jgi:hypothetical protein
MRYSHRREDLSAEKVNLSLPINTPVVEVLDMWISAVVAKVGSQDRAAFYLDIAPATVSRRLNRRRRKRGVLQAGPPATKGEK